MFEFDSSKINKTKIHSKINEFLKKIISPTTKLNLKIFIIYN